MLMRARGQQCTLGDPAIPLRCITIVGTHRRGPDGAGAPGGPVVGRRHALAADVHLLDLRRRTLRSAHILQKQTPIELSEGQS